MSDTKPKKDLRARLGRTIAPNTPGAPAITPPAVGAAAPAASGGAVTPPPAIAAPAIAAPAIAAPSLPFGGPDIAPPPFAQPKAAAEPPKPKQPSDPFAAGPAAAGPQEVRLVIDEKPVDDAEVGRQSRGRTLIVAALCSVLGAAVGGGFMSVNERNITYNLSVRDGASIYRSVNESSTHVLEAQTLIQRIATAAASTENRHVDYAAIEELRAMENPMPAQNFSRKSYWRFAAGTVDDLFHYYNNVQLLWESIERLGNTTLPEARRAELDRTAAGIDERANATFGAVLMLAPEEAGGGVIGQLAFLEEGSEPGHVLARGTRTGPGREFALYVPGDSEIASAPAFVIPIDGAGSAGVLAIQTGAFGEFVRTIQELNTLMTETVETQGRLTTALGEIATLPEVFTLGGPSDGEAAAAEGD